MSTGFKWNSDEDRLKYTYEKMANKTMDIPDKCFKLESIKVFDDISYPNIGIKFQCSFLMLFNIMERVLQNERYHLSLPFMRDNSDSFGFPPANVDDCILIVLLP